MRLFLVGLFSITALLSAEKPDGRLKTVNSVFVSGNNQAAEKARELLRSGKTCLALADKAGDADAVMEIRAEGQTQGGNFGMLGGRNWIASATLTLSSGALIWSHSERFMDAPLKSGGKAAGALLVNRLVRDAACKQRPKD